MKPVSEEKFKHYYQSHLKHLKLKGLQPKTIEAPGRPEESHHQPPTEPCVSLSTYTARPSHPLATSR